jgi:cytosine/adenosine deaminase-related metal-dependent hydrolase
MEIYAASHLIPITSPPLAGGAIAVSDGCIVDMGSTDRIRREYGGEIKEFPGCIITPGLVNAHSHLELTHFPSWKLRKGIDYSPRTYVDWVIQIIKIRRALTRPELEHSVMEGIRVSLECGTTSVGEIVTDRSLISLYETTPITGRIFLEAIGQDPIRTCSLLEEVKNTLDSFPNGKFKPGISPHAPHTLSAGFLKNLAELAEKLAIPAAVHLSESKEEAAFMFDSTGKIAELLYPFADWNCYIPAPRRTTSAAYLEGLGVLTPRTSVVHCVHVSPDDVQIMKRCGVSAILCPRSNERLAVGKAPAALLKKCGIPLALGTDSLASNDSLSLWDEMRFLINEFPGVFAPEEVLAMATIGSARALHLDEKVGSLEKGKRADFLVVQPGRPVPHEGVAEVLIEESRLLEVYINGNLV